MTHDTDTNDDGPVSYPEHTRTAQSADTDLSRFQLEILYILARDDGADYGLGIKDSLSAHYGEEINHGRLYPNLNELVEDGFIEKSERDRRTNEYALTEQARRLLRRDAQWRFGIVDQFAESDA